MPSALRKIGFEITFESSAGVWETYQFKGVIANWSVLGSWSNDLSLKKIDKTAIKQALGTSPTDVMSQKGGNDEIAQLAEHGEVFTISGYINITGGLNQTPTRMCTDFLDISFLQTNNFIWGSGSSNPALLAYYDENKNFISSLYGVQYNATKITILKSEFPIGAKYIRASSHNDFSLSYVRYLDLESISNNFKLETSTLKELKVDKKIWGEFSRPIGF